MALAFPEPLTQLTAPDFGVSCVQATHAEAPLGIASGCEGGETPAVLLVPDIVVGKASLEPGQSI